MYPPNPDQQYRTNKSFKLGPIKTSKIELIDILKAWVVLSLAFAIVLAPNFLGFDISLFRGGFSSLSNIFTFQFLIIFGISLFTAGLGFLFHELAHKFVAQKYGCVAEFRAFDQMLYLALGLAVVIGFIFAAPGAVMIAGHITRKENGIISLAGPLTNYTLAGIFLGLLFLFPTLSKIFSIGAFINMFLGLFNMIPFGNFDGKKILYWNRYIWLAMVVLGVASYIFIF
ncbi:MAG: metalloprotease [archaeon]